jgi:hypothetical protein
MGKLSKVILAGLGAWCVLALLHASLNLGFDPRTLLGGKREDDRKVRFRVGFLPVT